MLPEIVLLHPYMSKSSGSKIRQCSMYVYILTLAVWAYKVSSSNRYVQKHDYREQQSSTPSRDSTFSIATHGECVATTSSHLFLNTTSVRLVCLLSRTKG